MNNLQKSIIPLMHYPDSVIEACYLAIVCHPDFKQRLLKLSPMLMEWQPGVYLLDMKVVKSFWQKQASRLSKSPFALWEDLLTEQVHDFSAVLANHPWQCIVTLEQIKKQELKGLVNLSGPFGQKIFSGLNWQSFFEPLLQLAKHWTETKILQKFDPGVFSTQIKQWTAAMQRLDVTGPLQLKKASPDAFMRRFGKYLGLTWQWLWQKSEDHNGGIRHLFLEDPLSGRLAGFPWRLWQAEKRPQVARDLDQALQNWEEIAPVLQADFDRLCTKKDDWQPGRERILSISWDITFYSLKTLKVKVKFRNPHNLSSEIGAHKSALMQTQMAYESALKEAFCEHEKEDNPYGFSLVSWQLTIDETLYLCPNLCAWLEPKGGDDEERILQLENQSRVPLMRFQLKRDFVPEAGFFPTKESHALSPKDQQWYLGAKMRPLFFFAKTRPFSPPVGKQEMRFLERVYIRGYPNVVLRDYFIFREEVKSPWLWVYRDQDGEWFSHGVYK